MSTIEDTIESLSQSCGAAYDNAITEVIGLRYSDNVKNLYRSFINQEIGLEEFKSLFYDYTNEEFQMCIQKHLSPGNADQIYINGSYVASIRLRMIEFLIFDYYIYFDTDLIS